MPPRDYGQRGKDSSAISRQPRTGGFTEFSRFAHLLLTIRRHPHGMTHCPQRRTAVTQTPPASHPTPPPPAQMIRPDTPGPAASHTPAPGSSPHPPTDKEFREWLWELL